MPQNTTAVTTNDSETFFSERNEPAHPWGSFSTGPGTVALSSAVLQHERIAVAPNILNGEPYVRGTRIPIAVILDGLAEGLTREKLIEHYPRLTLDDIQAAMEYAGAMAISPENE